MLVPLSWLREFTPYEGTAKDLGDRLTMLGLELEEIINPFSGIKDIVVGYVSQCLPHPDSDHLHVCKVDVGSGIPLDIVCGAPNVATGQKVAVARVGVRLPDGTLIKKAKLRGQPSEGMICSERELGLSDDHDGILVLPDSADIGHRLVDALNMDCEVLNLSVTPNRGDCLSILGVARETAMAFNLPFNVPDLPLILDRQAKEMTVPVSIENPDLCWLYSGRVISNVAAGKSPMRMRYRLLAVGVRAISNIVDITNYILFECGQPLHAFDLDKLQGGRIIVRTAKEGEKLVTLDGRERILTGRDLCICDAAGPVGLAGVMGGKDSEIGADSKNVFLESAVFKPGCIRGTARRLGLNSEASFRFERGIDQRRAIWALDRACALMASICGGNVNQGFSVVEPKPFRPAEITFHPARADAILGADINLAFQLKVLQAIGCGVTNIDGSVWHVEQPSWRHDLTRETDLVEEVGRVFGLDTITPVLPGVLHTLDDNFGFGSKFDFEKRIKHWGAGLGLNEAVNYSFVGQNDLDLLNLEKDDRIAIFNPLSEDQNVLRTCLAPGLLRDLANNLAFGGQSCRLFEVANGFTRDFASETNARETSLLGMLLYGLRHEQAWPHVEADLDYTDLRGLIANLMNFLHLAPPIFMTVKNHPYLLPCLEIRMDNGTLGYMGRVKPDIAHVYHAQKSVWLCELNMEMLWQAYLQARIQFKPLPVYPAVKRDITVMAPLETRVEDILENIMLQKLPLLEGAVLLDCYQPAGTRERNLTFRLTFRHQKRTLQDAEVDKEREKVAKFLCDKMGVRI